MIPLSSGSRAGRATPGRSSRGDGAGARDAIYGGSPGISPPPTDRLWLDLPGATKPRRADRQPGCDAGHQAPQGLPQQAAATPPRQRSQDVFGRAPGTSSPITRHFSPSPIRAVVKPRSSLDQDTLTTLNVQERVLAQLNMRTADRSQRARKLLDIFRSCNPDEFGLINVGSFHRRFGKLFDLTPAESARLFHIGDPDNLQELDYARFRNCFVPIDTDKDALQCDTFRPSMRMVKPFPNNGHGDNGSSNSDAQFVSEHSIVQGMAREKRARYLMHKRVQVLLEQQSAALELCFRTREDTTGKMNLPLSSSLAHSSHYSPPRQTMVRTKLTFAQLEAALRKCGMNMAGITPNVLEDMFSSGNCNGSADTVPRIGFSELVRASDTYFALLGQSEEALVQRAVYAKMHDMYGRRLGRRAVGKGPAAGGHLSQPGFLAHDDGRLGISSPDAMDSHLKLHSSASTGRLQFHATAQASNMQASPSARALPLAASSISTPSSSPSTAWNGPVAGVSSKPSSHNPIDFGVTASGAPPRYDQAFANDPKKHLWESRWLDKKLPNQKRHLAKKALLGSNDLARKQNHDMATWLSFDENYGAQSQRERMAKMQLEQPREAGLGRYWG